MTRRPQHAAYLCHCGCAHPVLGDCRHLPSPGELHNAQHSASVQSPHVAAEQRLSTSRCGSRHFDPGAQGHRTVRYYLSPDVRRSGLSVLLVSATIAFSCQQFHRDILVHTTVWHWATLVARRTWSKFRRVPRMRSQCVRRHFSAVFRVWNRFRSPSKWTLKMCDNGNRQ